VGLLQLPSGDTLEVVPKTAGVTTIEKGRAAVLRMLSFIDAEGVEAPDALVASIRGPLREALITRFLQAAEHLIASGLRSQYQLVQSDEPYLRGRLRLSEMVRRPPYARATFPIEHDEFKFDRPENRLLHWALRRVYEWSREDSNRRLARSLISRMSAVPVSSNVKSDWSKWELHRLMRGYAAIRWWIALLIAREQPLAQRGIWHGISLLFPAERLFERYVYQKLRSRISAGYISLAQRERGWLATHVKENWFCLKPDIGILYGRDAVSVLDTKWKLLDAESDKRGDKYGIAQDDMYQLFAYGHKVVKSSGDIFLIYPRTDSLDKPLPAFSYSSELRLWVVPFDLEEGGLVEGEWCVFAPWFRPVALASPAH
jgi:5-methylcytosine-specific restriction enzyme subunit McrC